MTVHTFDYTERDCRVAAETLGEQARILAELLAGPFGAMERRDQERAKETTRTWAEAIAVTMIANDEMERRMVALVIEAAHFAGRALFMHEPVEGIDHGRD